MKKYKGTVMEKVINVECGNCATEFKVYILKNGHLTVTAICPNCKLRNRILEI